MGILSIVHNLRSRKLAKKYAFELFMSLVGQSQLPTFQHKFCIPDSIYGRFEALTLHMFLILQRIKNCPATEDYLMARNLGQALYDTMWGDFDQNLREMGVGDLRVGKKIKEMVQAFHGHVQAYENCDLNHELWAECLLRNVYRAKESLLLPAGQLADYVIQSQRVLSLTPLDHLCNAQIKWPEVT